MTCQTTTVCTNSLRHDLLDNPTVNIGQPKISTCIPISQLLVIEPQQVQQRCVQIMHMNLVLDRLVPELIGRTVGET